MKKLILALTILMALAGPILAANDWGAANPDALTFEKSWLIFEANYLTAKLQINDGNKDLATLLFPGTFSKSYGNDFLSTVALLHCNNMGVPTSKVKAFIERTAGFAEYYRPTMACISDFSKNPQRFWPQYKGPSDGPLQKIIRDSMGSDVVLAYLTADSWGGYPNYQTFFVQRGLDLEKNSKYYDALDVYARLADQIAAENPTLRLRAGNYLIHADAGERQNLQTLQSCAGQLSGQKNPYAYIEAHTSTKNYRPGIPCVDAKGTPQQKIDTYRRLGLAIRSPTFKSIMEQSEDDLGLLRKNLAAYGQLVDEINALEAKYPISSVSLDERFATLDSNIEKLVNLNQYTQRVSKEQFKTVTLDQATSVTKGVQQCGTGLAAGLISKDSLIMMGTGALAGVACTAASVYTVGASAPACFSAVGMMFVGSGVAMTGLSAYTLDQQWADLDLTGKTEGICNTAASAAMTLAGAKATFKEAGLHGVKIEDFSPTKTLWKPKLSETGKAKLSDWSARLKGLKDENGETVPEAVAVAQTPLEKLLDSIPKEKQSLVEQAAQRLDYENLGENERYVFDNLAKAFGNKDGLKNAFLLRADKIQPSQGIPTPPDFAAWNEFGGDVLTELVTGEPASFSKYGRDKPVVKSITDGFSEQDYQSYDKYSPQDSNPLTHYGTISVKTAIVTDRLVTALTENEAFLREIKNPDWHMRQTADAVPYLRKLMELTGEFDANDLQDLNGLLAGFSTRGDALASNFADAARAIGVDPAQINSIQTKFLNSGRYSRAYKVTMLDGAGREMGAFIFKMGEYEVNSFKLQKVLGDLDITSKPLIDHPMDQFVKPNAHSPLGRGVTLEEYVKGKTVWDATEPNSGYDAKKVSNAVGNLVAKLYFKTATDVGGSAKAIRNSDLNYNNIMVFDNPKTGKMEAKIVDFDSKFTSVTDGKTGLAGELIGGDAGGKARTSWWFLSHAEGSYGDFAEGIIQGAADSAPNPALVTQQQGLALAQIRQFQTFFKDPQLQAVLDKYASIPSADALPVLDKLNNQPTFDAMLPYIKK